MKYGKATDIAVAFCRHISFGLGFVNIAHGSDFSATKC